VSLSATALAFLIGIPGAYALASLRIKRKNFIAFNILSIRMLPPIAVIPSIYLMMYFLGLVDTHLGMILVYTVFDLPWVIWIMRAFMQQIPSELAEAAELDGASRLTYLTRILLPLVKPGLAVTAVFCILQGWNDFPVAFILCGRHTITVPVALSTLMSGRQLLWNGIFAVGVINMIPALILTFSVRKYWAKGLTLGLVE